MSKNTIKTFVLLAAFGGLFMVIGSFWGVSGLCIGLAIGLVMVGASYWFSDKLAVASAGAEPVGEQEAPELYAIVLDLARRTGAPMPRMYPRVYPRVATSSARCCSRSSRRWRRS